MVSVINRFLKEESGPTAVEYAIMLALVALAIALATPSIRTAVVGTFDRTANALSTLNP